MNDKKLDGGQEFDLSIPAVGQLLEAFEGKLGKLNDKEEGSIREIIKFHKISPSDVDYFASCINEGVDCERLFDGYKELITVFIAFSNQRMYAPSIDATQEMVALDTTEVMGFSALANAAVQDLDGTIEMKLFLDEDE